VTRRVDAGGRRYVALLRGINVGGKNTLPMANLVRLFAEAGCTDVSTYIQSGNVAFTATAHIVKELSDTIARRIQEDSGLTVPVILRSAGWLERVVASNPFPRGDVANLHVMFLKDRPTPSAVGNLDANRSPGDAFRVVGCEIYMRCKSVAKTKLTNAYFDTRLATVSTCRNWNTVLKLLEMTAR
jgi:uncharacterized protein (DUF1697 family)